MSAARTSAPLIRRSTARLRFTWLRTSSCCAGNLTCDNGRPPSHPLDDSNGTQCARTIKPQTKGPETQSPRDMWSWGESNPRPTLSLHAFSGRSLCRRSARLRPLSQTPKSTSPAWEESHVTSRRHHAARFLDDARIRIGITYGLTDYRARLCSEGEVVALGFGNYFFAESVYEITLHPRPASRGFTGAVETDQPRGPSLEGAAVTLWNYHLGDRSTRASQNTTSATRPPFLTFREQA